MRGTNVVLAFFPAAFSGPCTDQLSLLQELKGEFEKLNAQVVGISVDGPWAQKAFARQLNLEMPLLSDFYPHGEVARTYGVFRDDGVSERALFVVDGKGVIRYSYVSPILENPGADKVLEVLEGLRKGG
jgi:peroxiredoxin (alkyl hydroperoxide reductase subunit C)